MSNHVTSVAHERGAKVSCCRCGLKNSYWADLPNCPAVAMNTSRDPEKKEFWILRVEFNIGTAKTTHHSSMAVDRDMDPIEFTTFEAAKVAAELLFKNDGEAHYMLREAYARDDISVTSVKSIHCQEVA